MKSTLRLAGLALVALAALVFAGNALATQRIAVSHTSSSLTIKLSQAQSDQQPAKITIYIPEGYVLSPSGTLGSKIGTTSGQVFARDLNIPLPLTGDVMVDDPAKHVTDACSPGQHAAVWILQLSVAGQTINLPVYVSPTSGAEASRGIAKLEICLGSADTPQGTPNRAPNGAQLLDATFSVNNTVTPPARAARWISLWTPYATGSPLPNPAGTVEARSFVGPGVVTIQAKVTNRAKKLVSVTGRVTQSGVAVVGARVNLLLNSKSRFRARTSASGSFTFRLQNTKRRVTTTFFQGSVTAGSRDLTSAGCTEPTVTGVQCVSATAGPFTARSQKVKVRL